MLFPLGMMPDESNNKPEVRSRKYCRRTLLRAGSTTKVSICPTILGGGQDGGTSQGGQAL